MNVIGNSQPQLSQVQTAAMKTDPSDMEDFQGSLVDSAVSEFPGVFTEVFRAQKSHADEMSRRKQTLNQLQEKLEKVDEAKEESKSEILIVINRIFMAKESVKVKEKLLKETDSELKKLIVEIVDKETEIEALQGDIDFGKRNHSLKLKQLKKFVEEVEEYENQSVLGLQILAAKERIKSLQEHEEILNKDLDEKENILSGKTKAIVNTDIRELQQKIEISNQNKKDVEEKISLERERQAKITKETHVLGKKHTAQMTRQKHQLRELQMRNKQRQLHVTQLVSNITRAKKDLET